MMVKRVDRRVRGSADLRPRKLRPPAVLTAFLSRAICDGTLVSGLRGLGDAFLFILHIRRSAGISVRSLGLIAAKSVEVLFSDLPQGGLPGWFHHPCLGMARAGPSRSIGPLPGGSMGFFTIIKH